MKILKKLDPSEIYDGKVAASAQNEDHVYVLYIEPFGYWRGLSYRAIARIENGKAIKIPDGARHPATGWDLWVETAESRKLDPKARREDVFKELGI